MQLAPTSCAYLLLLLFCGCFHTGSSERPEWRAPQARQDDISRVGAGDGELVESHHDWRSNASVIDHSHPLPRRMRQARARFQTHGRARAVLRPRQSNPERGLAKPGATVTSRGRSLATRLTASRHAGANLQLASRRLVNRRPDAATSGAAAAAGEIDAGDAGASSAATMVPRRNDSTFLRDSNTSAELGAALGVNATGGVSPYVLMMARPSEKPQTWTEAFFALGSGTGAGAGAMSGRPMDWRLNQELALRMRCQDEAVLCLLILVYLLTLGLSASLAYKQSSNSSPVTYYADPRSFSSVMEGLDVRDFLENFNNPPKDVQMQVTGFVLTSEDVPGSVEWRDEHYSVAFTFALDLTPWVVRETLEAVGASTGATQATALSDGAVEEDVGRLAEFLAHNQNDLAMVEVHKSISWQNWEDLATNIKHHIRQLGFHGVIGITKTNSEVIPVYKNKQWANFMHSRTIKVLCALSMFGWIFYVPYMWLRTTRLTVRSFFRVNITIDDYWPLIADSLSAYGFLYRDD